MPHRKLIARLQAVVGLSEQDQAKLARMPYKLKTLDNGAYIFRQGDRPKHSIIVISGFLSRQKVVSDRNQISSFYIAGDMPDLHSLHLPVMDHELCSVGTSTVASVPHAYLKEVMNEAPALTQAFWRETLIHASIYREWVENLGARQALGRIAHLLCELATRLELVGLLDNASFHLPFVQQNVADACGLSVVHVNRVVQELRRQGLIEWQHHTVQLLDRAALEEAAEFSRDYLHALESAPSPIVRANAGAGANGAAPRDR
ncbi:Crp/Fnr family transcriptional regulator [Bradyrhizobium cosmicum]|uniref:Crp/Fnr family transcriptional regulator n=1 Tax=Bradyrhizobium cosmicum TaxID=1404864 RepID=UPI0028F0672C|nr:Crp/Fnr family transcriptional regulator [Bradyrhizobium cosmicum]